MAGNLTTRCRNTPRSDRDCERRPLAQRSPSTCVARSCAERTLNTMVDQLNRSPRGDARRARGRHEGKLGARPTCRASPAPERLDRQRQLRWPHLTGQVRTSRGDHRVRRGDLSRKITVDVKGEILSSRTPQHHGGPAQRLRRRSDARGTRGRHRRQAGGQAQVPGSAGTGRTSPTTSTSCVEPHRTGAQHCRVATASPAATCRRRSRSTCAARSCCSRKR